MSPRRWLIRNTIVLLVSAFVAVTTLLLAAVLAAGQDATAAVVVRGALWVAVVVFLAALITQLGLLTWMELNRRDETMTASQSPTEPHGES